MVKHSLDTVFGSLSDTTRRDILQRLSKGELTVSDIADTYHMSLPAISKHLKVLEQSNLIIKEKRGRQYFVRLTPTGFNNASEHLNYYEAALTSRLEAFNAFLRKEKPTHKKSPAAQAEEEQELVMTAVLDADPETAWKAYTDPASVAQWWRPEHTKLVSCDNDVRPNGIWRFALQATDGHTYVFSGRYTDVVYPHRLEYTDGAGEADTPRPESHVTITFEALSEGKTLLTKRSVATPAVHQLQAAWVKASAA